MSCTAFTVTQINLKSIFLKKLDLKLYFCISSYITKFNTKVLISIILLRRTLKEFGRPQNLSRLFYRVLLYINYCTVYFNNYNYFILFYLII